MISLVELLLGEQKYRIYCDMDGVLSNFNGRFHEMAGQTPEEYQQMYGKSKFWKAIDGERERFWDGMDWMPDGKQLWSYIEKHNPELLSAPSSKEYSHTGKKNWVDSHLPGVKLNLKPAKEKVEFCEKPTDILIDDKPSTIDSWNAKGGIGILHTNTANTIKQLKKLGL